MFKIYCASTWAAEGFTEALSHEVKAEWNVHFTCVEPGGFRILDRTLRGLPHPALGGYTEVLRAFYISIIYT